jgi:hypothetical protein
MAEVCAIVAVGTAIDTGEAMQHSTRWCLIVVSAFLATACAQSAAPGLWGVYDTALAGARYIDLTHTLAPDSPVWHGFGPATFGPSVNPETGEPYTYASDGFEATRYVLTTDQFGTQLDPPAHWAPEYPTIDELPPTYALRPLVVISIVAQVERDPGYHLAVADIEAPLARSDSPMHWNEALGVRER